MGADELAVLVHEGVVACVLVLWRLVVASMYHIPSLLLYRYHRTSHRPWLDVIFVYGMKLAKGMTACPKDEAR